MLDKNEEPQDAAQREFFEEVFDTMGMKEKDILNLKKELEIFFKIGKWVKFVYKIL